MPSLSLSPWPHSTFQSGLNKFCLGTNSTSRTCKRCYWHWSNWCRVTDVFHHQRAVTSLSCKSPAQSQLAVEMTVLPVQLLLQLVPSLTENHRFSLWGVRSYSLLTLLLRQTTGHMEQPRVQQQQRQPNSSQRTLTGRAFLRVTLTRVTVACTSSECHLSHDCHINTLNSSGATRECKEEGNSVSNLFERPNLRIFLWREIS